MCIYFFPRNDIIMNWLLIGVGVVIVIIIIVVLYLVLSAPAAPQQPYVPPPSVPRHIPYTQPQTTYAPPQTPPVVTGSTAPVVTTTAKQSVSTNLSPAAPGCWKTADNATVYYVDANRNICGLTGADQYQKRCGPLWSAHKTASAAQIFGTIDRSTIRNCVV